MPEKGKPIQSVLTLCEHCRKFPTIFRKSFRCYHPRNGDFNRYELPCLELDWEGCPLKKTEVCR